MANISKLRSVVRLLRAVQRSIFRNPIADALLQRYANVLCVRRGMNLEVATDYLVKNHLRDVTLDAALVMAKSAEQLLQQLRSEISGTLDESHAIPKIIWMYWNNGLVAAPDVVQVAYRSWQEMNPDYEVRFLDDDSVRDYCDINLLFANASLEHTVAHRADLLRTYLLARHGGVWADSTTWCWQPLSAWLDKESGESGFFMFRQPESRQDRQITNWFICSSAGNPISVGMFDALCDYIFKRRDLPLQLRKPRHYAKYPGQSRTGTGYGLLDRLEREGYYPYFYYHYLFNEVVAHGEPARIWAQVIKSQNLHAKNQGAVDNVFVSKQTHKGDYQTSSDYRERNERLLALLGQGTNG